MGLRDELLAEVGPKTHIANICGRAADDLLIKEMKIDQQEREINRLRACLWSIGHAAGCETKEDLMRVARETLPEVK